VAEEGVQIIKLQVQEKEDQLDIGTCITFTVSRGRKMTDLRIRKFLLVLSTFPLI
jgi:hypothetical protein